MHTNSLSPMPVQLPRAAVVTAVKLELEAFEALHSGPKSEDEQEEYEADRDRYLDFVRWLESDGNPVVALKVYPDPTALPSAMLPLSGPFMASLSTRLFS